MCLHSIVYDAKIINPKSFISPSRIAVKIKQLSFISAISGDIAHKKQSLLKQNFSKGKSLYREGMSPCVRSTSRPKWTRLPSQQCYYWRNDGGCYILSFTFKFDLEERYEFAYCYPYSYTELQNYLSSLAPELVERSIIGQTLQKRNMDLLSIGEGNRTIVVMARRVVLINLRVS